HRLTLDEDDHPGGPGRWGAGQVDRAARRDRQAGDHAASGDAGPAVRPGVDRQMRAAATTRPGRPGPPTPTRPPPPPPPPPPRPPPPAPPEAAAPPVPAAPSRSGSGALPQP